MSTKPLICIWADLSLPDVRNFLDCKSPKEVKKFCKEQNFNEEQTSAFYSIVKKTHEKAIETSFGNLQETFTYFRNLLLCHSAKRPPFCVQLYEVNQVKSIQEYILRTYFHHFKLYKYAFTPKIVMNVSIKYEGVIEETVKEPDDAENEIQHLKDEEEQEDEEIASVAEETESEDPPAVKELKKMIETTLDEQISKLKESVDHQLKLNEDNILKKLTPGKDSKTEKKGKKT